MKLYEARQLLNTHMQQLNEGIYDPHIFKAVFMAGSGGAGKGFAGEVLFGKMPELATTGLGLKVVNADDLLTAAAGQLPIQKRMNASGLGGLKPFQLKGGWWDARHPRTGMPLWMWGQQTVAKRKAGWIEGRLGIILDATARKPERLYPQKMALYELGYDTMMVLVRTSLEVALARAHAREREVADWVIRDAHERVERSIPMYKKMFGRNFAVIDNNEYVEDARTLWPEAKQVIDAFLQRPTRNEPACIWLLAQLAARKIEPAAYIKGAPVHMRSIFS